MDNAFQGEHDGFEEPIPEDGRDDESEFDQDQGIDWELWWQIIVHRNEGVREAEPPEYPRNSWSLDEKHAPFPLNLRETWYCATLLVSILAVHCELDTEWLLRYGYRHYFIRISLRIILTVAISFFSTLAFEIAGNIFDMTREAIIDRISFQIDIWFIRRLGWGPVDDGGGVDWNNRILFNIDRTYLREPMRKTANGIAVLAFNYVFTVASYGIPRATGSGLVWLMGVLSAKLARFAANLPSRVALPTPGADGDLVLETVLWEYGVPALIQVCVAAFLYLSVFLFMSRAETPIILGRGGQDPFSKLAFQLLRATAMHLLAYTAYQVVCIGVVAGQIFWPSDNIFYFLTKRPLIGLSNPQLAFRAAVLTLAAHWLVKRACKLFVNVFWPLWIPYIAWLSIKTEESTRQNWIVYGSLLDEDIEIFNPDKRVLARACMTAWFGIESSWPARMRLSTGEGID